MAPDRHRSHRAPTARRHGNGAPDWRTRGDDQRLVRRHRAGDRHARATLIERYLPLARAVAWRFRGTPEELEDLVQVACVGLVKAVDRWDPDRGFAFSSFAVPTILGEVRRHLRDRSWCVRPPRALQELCLALERAREELRASTGREPTVAALAERLGRSPAEVSEALLATRARTGCALDAPAEDGPLDAAIAAQEIGDHEPGYARAEARVTIAGLVGDLDDRARTVLGLRFVRDLIQSEIAAEVGCSQMHVSRILATSLEGLHTQAVAPAGTTITPQGGI